MKKILELLLNETPTKIIAEKMNITSVNARKNSITKKKIKKRDTIYLNI